MIFFLKNLKIFDFKRELRFYSLNLSVICDYDFAKFKIFFLKN